MVPFFYCRDSEYSLALRAVKYHSETQNIIYGKIFKEYSLTSETKVLLDGPRIRLPDDPDEMAIEFQAKNRLGGDDDRPAEVYAKTAFEYIKHLISKTNNTKPWTRI